MENCREILKQGLQTLDIASTESQVDLLLAFIQLIDKWNKAYNLTAVRNKEDMVRLHILDSLTVLPYIEGDNVADIGTGAGLPGIPLAIFLPETRFVLVDSNSKKTRFVQQAILELKLKNVSVVHARVEKMNPISLFSTVIMRAFANVHDIMTLTTHLLDKRGILLAMKGQQLDEDIRHISAPYSIIPLTIPELEVERCLIKIEIGSTHE